MKTFNSIKLILSNATEKDRNRILSTNKEFIVCEVSVFNAGSVIVVRCTNDYNRYQNVSNDGYSFIMEAEVIKNMISWKKQVKSKLTSGLN